tara:strand:- start:4645 stop:5559 length:915 start_codon:yes stop_codon:yes gene_type:complete
MSLFHRASDFMLQNLPDKHFRTLRSSYFTARRKLAPITRLMHGTFDAQQLRAHLEQHLDGDFEILMVHGSINRMLPAYTGNALELVNMLIDFCGPDRTLVMPAFFFGDPKVGSVQQTFTANPRFDLKRTASQMGLFTELFRRSKGVMQSHHPVYRVAALGPLAAALTQTAADKPAGLGEGSPFDFMATHKTQILGIGKSYHVMTQVHHVDELLGEALPVPRLPLEKRKTIDVTVFDRQGEYPATLTDSGIQWRFNIDKLPKLLENQELQVWKFCNVPLFSADARRVTERLVAQAQKGNSLYDPV